MPNSDGADSTATIDNVDIVNLNVGELVCVELVVQVVRYATQENLVSLVAMWWEEAGAPRPLIRRLSSTSDQLTNCLQDPRDDVGQCIRVDIVTLG